MELQLCVNHFSTLCRWKDWDYEGHKVQGVERYGLSQEKEKEKAAAQKKADETENKLIYPLLRNVKPERSRKLAAYDLEASPDDNMRGCVKGSKHFRTYAMGFGWIDVEGEQHYESFYGYKGLVCYTVATDGFACGDNDPFVATEDRLPWFVCWNGPPPASV